MQENNKAYEDYKEKILKRMLSHIPFDGWTEELFKIVAKELKTDEMHLRLYFENGIIDVVDFFSAKNDSEMIRNFLKLLNKEPQMRIRDRIKNAILERLKIYDKMKTTVSKTTSFLSLPWNAPYCTKFIWRTSNIIWHEAANDKSTDFNYYTKRSLLAGIYTATIMYWLADDSENYTQTKDFLDRRIEDVMKIGKFLGKKK